VAEFTGEVDLEDQEALEAEALEHQDTQVQNHLLVQAELEETAKEGAEAREELTDQVDLVL
jgi:hypothetical protein